MTKIINGVCPVCGGVVEDTYGYEACIKENYDGIANALESIAAGVPISYYAECEHCDTGLRVEYHFTKEVGTMQLVAKVENEEESVNMSNVLTKEEIKTELHKRLDVAVDRMYDDNFELDLSSEEAFEFVELSLKGHKKYPNLDSHDAVEEVVVLTGDRDTDNKIYAEFDTRRKIEYRFDSATHQGKTTYRDLVYYKGDGTREVLKDDERAFETIHQFGEKKQSPREDSHVSNWFECMVMSQLDAFKSSIKDDSDSPLDVEAIEEDYQDWLALLPVMCKSIGINYDEIVEAVNIPSSLVETDQSIYEKQPGAETELE